MRIYRREGWGRQPISLVSIKGTLQNACGPVWEGGPRMVPAAEGLGDSTELLPLGQDRDPDTRLPSLSAWPPGSPWLS